VLDEAVDELRLLIRHLEQVADPAKKPAQMSGTKTNKLDNLITLISVIEGKLRAVGLGVS
jgi:hypothetical protein